MTKRAFRWLVTLGTLAGLLAAGCVGCAYQQNTHTLLSQSISYAKLSGYLGVTYCFQGKPYSFISTELNDWEEVATRAHEAKHREQARRFDSCEAFTRWHQTPKGTVAAESEAYHAGLCAAVARGADPIALRQSYVDRIVRLLGSEANRHEVDRAFTSLGPCPRP